MPSDDIIALVKDDRVGETLRQFAPYLNASVNRQGRSAVSEFGRRFTAARLVKGGVEIRKRGALKAREKGQPSLPAKMRRAGFKARLAHEERLEGKKFIIRTRNPAMIAHQLGLLIRAGTGKGRRKWLTVPFSDQPKGISPEQIKNAFVVQLKGHAAILAVKTSSGDIVGIAALVKQVQMKARLQFLETWDGYSAGPLLGRLDKAVLDTLKRAGFDPPASAEGTE